MNSAVHTLDTRVLVVTPTPKDCALLIGVCARHGIEVEDCTDLGHVCEEMARGAGALLIAEEALTSIAAFMECLQHQPPWSDLPILVLARPGADSTAVADTTRKLGNVTILDRPIRVANLISTLQSALRARHRQYQIREYLAEQRKSEEQLRANDQRKDEFLAILAHELRNPLAPISNGLQILNMHYRDHAETAPVREAMERQLGSMKRLVDDLLEVSRVTRGQMELHIEYAELATIINAAIDLSRPLINASQHHLEVRLPEQAVYLHGDVVRLAQVISNLLNNAAKYTRAGGYILLTVRRSERDVVISITDNGVGIAQDLQPKIFDMFMQVASSRNRAQGGLGIGLTLVKRLVELHGGTIDVFSEGLGKGSCFTVSLPLRDSAEVVHAADVPGAQHELAGLEVLIADDNRDAADTLGEVLRKAGAAVRVTYGGLEALSALAPALIDVVILDIGMPDMDGLTVARRIRAQHGHARPLLIALTGWGQRQDMIDTRNAGFDHHLTKPVDMQRLLNLLSTACHVRGVNALHPKPGTAGP
ncbi:MAG: hypothetical protein RLZZ227_913 [Pseudomonadota bacterium]|jgi:signal transduction histidine kinase/ActR/RegA family two-component response regulator